MQDSKWLDFAAGMIALLIVSLMVSGVAYWVGVLYAAPEPVPTAATARACDRTAARLVRRIFDLDEVPEQITSLSMWVTVSAYTARAEECDSTPEVTADMTPSRVGVLAVSPDMLSDGRVRYGDTVALIDGGEFLGGFVIHDTMNRRFTHRVDILHGNVRAALLFGIRHNVELIRVIGDAS